MTRNRGRSRPQVGIFDEWMVDVTDWQIGRPFRFCPLVDGQITDEFAVVGADPPGRVVGIAHSRGPTEFDHWFYRHPAEIAALNILREEWKAQREDVDDDP